MGKIFICYRREDSQSITDRIFDHLARHFSRKSLFKDVDNIPPGADFRASIDDAVGQSAVMLAIIGPGWLSVRDAAGQRRLDDPADPVCAELSSALRLQRSIVPVLVGGARMPTADELPPALKPLAYINAVQVRSDPDFTGDFTKLRRALEPIAGRWHSGWLTPMVIAAVVLGAVVAIVWYAVSPPPPSPASLPNASTVPVPARPDSLPPAAASTTPPKSCVDVPFHDQTKTPPVTTTKRLCPSFAGRADDTEQAVMTAQQILTLIEDNQLNTLWDTRVTKLFKDRVTRDKFLAEFSQRSFSVGGAHLSRQVVDVTYANQEPESGYKGDVYYCTFLSKYPGRNFYERVVVFKESDGQFRLAGYRDPVPALQEIALDAATLGNYVGKYQFDFGILDVTLNGDHLEAQLTGQPVAPIFASARDKFFYKIVNAQLDFERDAEGKVVAVVLHQNGRDMRAARLTSRR